MSSISYLLNRGICFTVEFQCVFIFSPDLCVQHIHRFAVLLRVWVWLSTGFWIGFIDHLEVVTTNNCNTMANLYRHYKIMLSLFPARGVFTSSCLVMASNNGYSSAFGLKSCLNGGLHPTASFLHRLPYRTDLIAPIVFLITFRQGLRRQNHSRMLTVSVGTCIPSRSLAAAVGSWLLRICCLATDVVPLSVSRQFPRNECCFGVFR
jgi:hypothetical protein